MEVDIAPELLETLQNDFRIKYNGNEKIKKLNKLLTEGNATYQEVNEMASELGEILASVYQYNLSSEMLPNGRMYKNIAEKIINPTMGNNYDLMATFIETVQTTMNRSMGIRIKGIRPGLNQDRIDGIITRVSKELVFDDVKWILDEPVKNFTQAIVDDGVKANSEFQYKAGLKPKIIRKEVGNCCAWCKEVVGTYAYPDVPEGVYKRHRYCRCTVEYYPGDGKRQDVHSKKWIDPEKAGKIEKRKELSILPKILKKDDIPTKTFKRGSGKNYPIKFIGSDHVKFGDDKITKVTVIAGDKVKKEIREANRLESHYKQPSKRWQKISGETYIIKKGRKIRAEIHWYEANGKRILTKVKRVFEDES